MRWIYKVAGFQLLGICPWGERLYGALQRNVTRSLEVTEARVAQKCRVGLDYLERLGADVPDFDPAASVHVDIGAGWMPTIPLLLYARGVERQVLCDVRRNLRIETVAKVAACFNRVAESEPYRRVVRRRVPEVLPGQSLEEYLASLGMEYRAPFCLADLHRGVGRRLVTCTQALYYLRPEALRGLLHGIAQAIGGEGVFATTLHLYDLYADADPRLNRYNKYRYPAWVWEGLINGRFCRLNRLTAPDYRRLLAESGLRPTRFELTPAGPEDLAALRKVPLDRQFRGIPEAELAAPHLLVVARGER